MRRFRTHPGRHFVGSFSGSCSGADELPRLDLSQITRKKYVVQNAESGQQAGLLLVVAPAASGSSFQWPKIACTECTQNANRLASDVFLSIVVGKPITRRLDHTGGYHQEMKDCMGAPQVEFPRISTFGIPSLQNRASTPISILHADLGYLLHKMQSQTRGRLLCP